MFIVPLDELSKRMGIFVKLVLAFKNSSIKVLFRITGFTTILKSISGDEILTALSFSEKK